MKVGLLAASLLFTSAFLSAAGAATVTMSPPRRRTKRLLNSSQRCFRHASSRRLQFSLKLPPGASLRTAAPVQPQTPSAPAQTAAKKDCPGLYAIAHKSAKPGMLP
jgi:hypothetical protein